MSAVAQRPPCGRSAPAGAAPTRSRAACSLVGTLVALVPLVLVLYYLIKQGLGALELDFFTTDPTGAFLGDPGGIKSAIARHDRDRRAGRADRHPDRHRRRAVPRRVRQGQPLRQRRPLLRRRDDRRAVDRLRPVRLHHARHRRLRRGGLRRLEGLGRAGAADAAGRDALGRGGAAARPRLAARGGAGARRAALARRPAGRAADRAARARHRLAARGRARRGRDRAAAVHVGDRLGTTSTSASG